MSKLFTAVFITGYTKLSGILSQLGAENGKRSSLFKRFSSAFQEDARTLTFNIYTQEDH